MKQVLCELHTSNSSIHLEKQETCTLALPNSINVYHNHAPDVGLLWENHMLMWACGIAQCKKGYQWLNLEIDNAMIYLYCLRIKKPDLLQLASRAMDSLWRVLW